MDGDPVRLNNSKDREMQPFAKEIVVRRAEGVMTPQTALEVYSLLSSNCESFVTWS